MGDGPWDQVMAQYLGIMVPRINSFILQQHIPNVTTSRKSRSPPATPYGAAGRIHGQDSFFGKPGKHHPAAMCCLTVGGAAWRPSVSM